MPIKDKQSPKPLPQKALVTGAAGGIGQAIVAALKAQGAIVTAADRDTSSIDADHHLPGDLLDAQYADTLPQAACDAMGELDLVVNNAGVITRGAVTESSDADWALSLGVNVEAPFRICRAAIPIMAAAGGGVIVNIASCWGGKAQAEPCALLHDQSCHRILDPMYGDGPCSSKHSHQRRLPNEVNTPMLRSGFERRGFDPDTAIAALGETVPLGRIAEPEDIADVVMFLASDASRYMTGTLVEVNGGKPVT